MILQELKQQTLRALGKNFAEQVGIDLVAIMDDILKHYAERDRIAAERGQAPFDFKPSAVLWLERQVRARTVPKVLIATK